MPWIIENNKNYWMPDTLPEPTEEYQQEQSEKLYLTKDGKERRHPGWTYADNVAYVDDEYLFQNEGWKVVIDEFPTQPVSFRNHISRNISDQWILIDERNVKATYSIVGYIPEVLPEPTEEYQEEQEQKQYLDQDNNIVIHPGWSYTSNGALVDDEYLFQNEGWKVVIDEYPIEPVSNNRVHQKLNKPSQWILVDEKTVKTTYSVTGYIPEVIPEATEEYQEGQELKKYLNLEKIELNHPGWSYTSNGALVDDEYLFQNEGWKLIIDEYPVEPVGSKIHQKLNKPSQWSSTDDKTVKTTYTLTGYIPETLPKPTKEYQETQEQKQYVDNNNNVVIHPGWYYTSNDALVDDEYLFQNEGWKLIIDEYPVEPVSSKIHISRNKPSQWILVDEKTVKTTYSVTGYIPEVLPEPTEEYQEEQEQKQYLDQDNNIFGHPGWSYTSNGALVDDEYLFRNEGWKLIIDEYPVEPVIGETNYLKDTLDQWILVDDKTVKTTYSLTGYIPEVLPEPTKEYQETQEQKQYLDNYNNIVSHPGWSYTSNGALVDDEYLYRNKVWKLIIDEYPVEPVSSKIHISRNKPSQWILVDEKTVKTTYSVTGYIPETLPEPNEDYQIEQRSKQYVGVDNNIFGHPGWSYTSNGALVDDEYLFRNEGWKLLVDNEPDITDNDLKHKIRNPKQLWDTTNPKTVNVTYTINDFTENEIKEYKERKWQILRGKRDFLLFQTDWVIVRAAEENLTISSQVTSYRQQLRDFPQTIVDIIEFEIDDDALWPIKPNVYFGA